MIELAILGVPLTLIGALFLILSMKEDDSGLAVASMMPLIIGIILVICFVLINTDQNELINTPMKIEQMKQEVKTPEEKEIVNNEILTFNEIIKEYHKNLLTDKHRSKKEQKIFELQPIELIE